MREDEEYESGRRSKVERGAWKENGKTEMISKEVKVKSGKKEGYPAYEINMERNY